MSDRTNTITVVLEGERRTDDAQDILDAICMIKGVLTAKPNISSPADYMAEERAKHELGQKLMRAIYPKL